jgi:formylglycine-generating enzyme required for sulfatase activity
VKRALSLSFLTLLLLSSCTGQIGPLLGNPATLAPINLAGPDVTLGSMYAYANDTLIVAVPAGEFSMGYGAADNPIHQVWQTDFWILRTKVTNKQYTSCVSAGYCTSPNAQDNPSYSDAPKSSDPVVGVTYDQAAAYCTFIDAQLPTEAEWEKAARGPHGNIYPWGNGAPSCSLLNFNNCVGSTTDVTSYRPSQSYYGALDMEGNAFEWVADWYNPNYYRTSPATNPPGPDGGRGRSVRSSSYKSGADQVAASLRFFDLPSDHRQDLGFRCIVDKPLRFAPSCEHKPIANADLNQCLIGSVVDAANPCCSLQVVATGSASILSTLPVPLISSLPPTLSVTLPTLTPVPLPTLPLPGLNTPLPTLPGPVPPKPRLTPPIHACVPKVCIPPSQWNQAACGCANP